MTVTLSPKGTRGTEIPGFAKALMKAGAGLGNRIFNLMGDRMKMQGQPLVLLTTVGAKSGKQRQALLGRFDDTEHPGAWLVVGSNGGAARHPGWCHNLVANPDQAWATVDKKKTRVRADSVEGAEYQVAWDRIVSLAPGYGSYLKRPTATSRLSASRRRRATRDRCKQDGSSGHITCQKGRCVQP